MKTPDTYELLAADEYWDDDIAYPEVSILAQVVDLSDVFLASTQKEVRQRFGALENGSRREQLTLGQRLDPEAPAGSLMRIVLDERYRREGPMVATYANCDDEAAFNERAAQMGQERWYRGDPARYEYQAGDMTVRIARSVAYAVNTMSGRQVTGVLSSNIDPANGGFADRLNNVVLPKGVRVDAGYTTHNSILERGIHVVRAEVVSPLFPQEKIRGEKSPTLEASLRVLRRRATPVRT